LSWLSAAVGFAVLLALLAWRMESGNDPSLGAVKTATPVAGAPAARRVIIRRIERTVIVTRVLPPRPAPAAAAPAYPVSGAAVASAPAYVPPQRAAYVAPQPRAYVPPVRVAAPAPAPAPAPHVVTRAS
jgi:hypothetical protein